jgi:hypothetical protein
MKKLLMLFALPMLFLLVIGCKDDDPTEVTVDFTAQYTTYPVITDSDENGTLTIQIPSEGEGDFIGTSTWYSDCFVYNSATEDPPWVQEGSSIFTAEGGDQLIGTFTGTSGPVFDENGDLVYPFAGDGTFVITEGTGSFEGYTGKGTYSYTALEIDEVLTGDLEFLGTLTFLED